MDKKKNRPKIVKREETPEEQPKFPVPTTPSRQPYPGRKEPETRPRNPDDE